MYDRYNDNDYNKDIRQEVCCYPEVWCRNDKDYDRKKEDNCHKQRFCWETTIEYCIRTVPCKQKHFDRYNDNDYDKYQKCDCCRKRY
ncbi:MAG: hypothetical protein IKM43_02225 [Clostridia bacterium]|nr:hypothetical protein [Clostridia bacterium]